MANPIAKTQSTGKKSHAVLAIALASVLGLAAIGGIVALSSFAKPAEPQAAQTVKAEEGNSDASDALVVFR